MSELIKNEFLYEVAEELIQKFDQEISQDILNIINRHLYKYDIVEKESSALLSFDSKTEYYLKIYVGTKRLEGKSEKTLRQYYREIKLLLAFLGGCPIEKVTTNGVKLYLMTMKEERNLQNSTLENMRAYLNAVFTWFTNEKIIESNPCQSIVPIKIIKKVRESFSAEELDKIRESCKDNIRNLIIVNFLYSTGCRVSELCSINISDLNFEKKYVIILGKGSKERKVYLTDELCDILKKYLETRDDDNPALFISQKRKQRLSGNGIRSILHSLEAESGVKNIHPHRFRRTLATDLLNKGMPIQDVAKLLGHSRVETTQAYYYHTDDKVEAEFRKYI